MPLLTLTQRDPCILCGCRLRGFLIGTFRINKNSMRAPRGTIGANLPCPECGTKQPPGERYVPTAESAGVIAAHDIRKGWDPTRRPSMRGQVTDRVPGGTRAPGGAGERSPLSPRNPRYG